MWFDGIMTVLLKSPLHILVSGNVMLLTFWGHQSGRQYTTPINYLRDEKRLYTISLRKRTWWKNLRGGAQVWLRLQGQTVEAEGSVIEDQPRVLERLRYYFSLKPGVLKLYGIEAGEDGKPIPESLEQFAENKVFVTFTLDRI